MFKVRVSLQDPFTGLARGQETEHGSDRHAQAANAGLAPHHQGIVGDPGEPNDRVPGAKGFKNYGRYPTDRNTNIWKTSFRGSCVKV